MLLDEIIKEIENQLVARAEDAAKALIASFIPGSIAFFLTPVGNVIWNWFIAPIIIRPVAKWFVKQADNAGYYQYKTIVNNKDAAAFEDTIRTERVAIESGNKDAIYKARAEKRAAFLKLWPLTA